MVILWFWKGYFLACLHQPIGREGATHCKTSHYKITFMVRRKLDIKHSLYCWQHSELPSILIEFATEISSIFMMTHYNVFSLLNLFLFLAKVWKKYQVYFPELLNCLEVDLRNLSFNNCIQIDAFYTLVREYCTICNEACIFLSL